MLGARVLGQFGNDPNHYTDVKPRKNYARTSPLTVASGKKRAVLGRHVRNRRPLRRHRPMGLLRLNNSPAPAPSTTNTAPTATLTTNPYAVLPPQPLTVGGFVVVAIVGVDDAKPGPGQFL